MRCRCECDRDRVVRGAGAGAAVVRGGCNLSSRHVFCFNELLRDVYHLLSGISVRERHLDLLYCRFVFTARGRFKLSTLRLRSVLSRRWLSTATVPAWVLLLVGKLSADPLSSRHLLRIDERDLAGQLHALHRRYILSAAECDNPGDLRAVLARSLLADRWCELVVQLPHLLGRISVPERQPRLRALPVPTQP